MVAAAADQGGGPGGGGGIPRFGGVNGRLVPGCRATAVGGSGVTSGVPGAGGTTALGASMAAAVHDAAVCAAILSADGTGADALHVEFESAGSTKAVAEISPSEEGGTVEGSEDCLIILVIFAQIVNSSMTAPFS